LVIEIWVLFVSCFLVFGYYNDPMDPIERLSGLFERFPGIGPRQAQRFVQYLLRSSPTLRKEIADGIRALSSTIHQCPQCMRYHASEAAVCNICADTGRDQALLAVVVSDADLQALERSHTYHGLYFVLGGLIHLASEKTSGLRLRELKATARRSELQEIVLAFPANPEGDATASIIRHELEETNIKITSLGRGLSTGSELEYADPETLKSAIDNRK
jgi:recombination protein RecR